MHLCGYIRAKDITMLEHTYRIHKDNDSNSMIYRGTSRDNHAV
jgi:hypothetical protein